MWLHTKIPKSEFRKPKFRKLEFRRRNSDFGSPKINFPNFSLKNSKAPRLEGAFEFSARQGRCGAGFNSFFVEKKSKPAQAFLHRLKIRRRLQIFLQKLIFFFGGGGRLEIWLFEFRSRNSAYGIPVSGILVCGIPTSEFWYVPNRFWIHPLSIITPYR